MTGWFSETLSVNNLKIHYYRTGGEKPTVVMSHGATDDGLCWSPVTEALEPDYDIIMADARGHGLSGNQKGDYSVEARSTDLVGLIEALRLDKPVIMGHSLGAETSLYTAVHHPDLVGGVILEDPPIVLPGEPIFGGDMDMEKIRKMMVRVMKLFKYLPLFLAKPLARKMNAGWSDEELIPWIKSKRRLSGDFLSSMKSMDFESTKLETFEGLTCPAMMIIGDKEKGSIVSLDAAKEAQRFLPALKISHIQGATHNIRRDQFDAYVKVVRDFLAEICV